MGGNALGWAFDPIGTGLAGGPFWSKDNKAFGGGGGKGGSKGGRSLTSQERELIQAQINAFRQQQSQGRYVFDRARGAYIDVSRDIPGVRDAALAAADTSNFLARDAQNEGIRRIQLLRSTLSQQPGDIESLRGAMLRPDIGRAQDQATNMAMTHAGAPVWNPGINNQLLALGNSIGSPTQQAQFANMLMHARGNPAGANIFNAINAQAQQGAGRNPINGLQDIRSLGSQAARIGARPGAAEAVLTPGAIELLSAAQRGETPGAIQRLFQSDNTSERTALENQFDAARQRLVDRGIRGGALERSLAGLEGQRALGISQQEARLEGQARDATLGLLGQGTTYGLTQPFQREQLNLQGIQAGGQLYGLAGNLEGQQEQLRQGYLGIGLGAGQALSNEALQLQNLRQQALTAGGALAGDVYRNQLAGTDLRGQFLNQNIRNQLAANQAQTANIGLAGQLGAQQIASRLGISQQNAAILNDIMNQRSNLAGQLGAGGDMLRYQTGAGLLSEGVKLNTLGATAPGLALDLLTGGRVAGSGSVDLGSALAAINNAQNYQQGPSRAAAGISGGLGGAMAGAQVGSMIMPGYGTAIGAIGGGILGLFGGMS